MADPVWGVLPAQALRRQGLTPRKRLGQNFLRDRAYLSRILAAARLEAQDEVLELGAGTGVLTHPLAEIARRVVAVELDDALYELLLHDFAHASQVDIVHANALDVEPAEYFSGPYKLLGNIPYYVTGAIVRRYLELERQSELLVLMVQWEVAQRMAAPPGHLSLLGVSVQYYAGVEIVARVPAGAFFPRPKVDSAIVRLIPHRRKTGHGDEEPFFQVVRAGFRTRRKQLVNALGGGLDLPRLGASDLLERANIEGSRRAETLSLAEWERLASVWTIIGPKAGA